MVDDAVQNTLANVFRSLDTFDQRVPLSAWAVCLAKNVCADFLRAWQRRTIFSSAELGLDHPHDLDRGNHLPSLDDAIVAREDVRHILRRVAALDKTDQLVASLVLMGGSSAQAAADCTGLSAGAIRVRAFRIRSSLRASLRTRETLPPQHTPKP